MARLEQTFRLLEILDRGRDRLNEPDKDEETKTVKLVRLINPRQDLEETDRPDIAAYLGSSVQTERLVEERYEEEDSRRFEFKPMGLYVEHVTEGLEVEIGKVQLRRQELEAQLSTPVTALPDPPPGFSLPLSLEDLDIPPQKPIPQSSHPVLPLPKPSDSDPNDYSVAELERLKWQLMEEKRIQERVQRENAKLSNRVQHRIDLEAKLQGMKEMVNQLQVSVDHSKRLRKQQKGLIKVLQYQVDRKNLCTLEEKYPEYTPDLPLPRRRKKKRTYRPIIQHGRIAARRPSV